MNVDELRFWFWLLLLVFSPVVLLGCVFLFATTLNMLYLFTGLLSVLSTVFSVKYFTEPL